MNSIISPVTGGSISHFADLDSAAIIGRYHDDDLDVTHCFEGMSKVERS